MTPIDKRGALSKPPAGAASADAQIAALQRQIDELTRRLASLQALVQGECVRQTPGGQLVFPANSQRVQAALFGSAITLDAAGCRIEAAGDLSLNGARMTLSASLVQTSTGAANFTGVVKCDTIIANSVVGSSYTPGAGNLR